MTAAHTPQAEFVDAAKRFASSLSSTIDTASQSGYGNYTDQLKDAAQVYLLLSFISCISINTQVDVLKCSETCL